MIEVSGLAIMSFYPLYGNPGAFLTENKGCIGIQNHYNIQSIEKEPETTMRATAAHYCNHYHCQSPHHCLDCHKRSLCFRTTRKGVKESGAMTFWITAGRQEKLRLPVIEFACFRTFRTGINKYALGGLVSLSVQGRRAACSHDQKYRIGKITDLFQH